MPTKLTPQQRKAKKALRNAAVKKSKAKAASKPKSSLKFVRPLKKKTTAKAIARKAAASPRSVPSALKGGSKALRSAGLMGASVAGAGITLGALGKDIKEKKRSFAKAKEAIKNFRPGPRTRRKLEKGRPAGAEKGFIPSPKSKKTTKLTPKSKPKTARKRSVLATEKIAGSPPVLPRGKTIGRPKIDRVKTTATRLQKPKKLTPVKRKPKTKKKPFITPGKFTKEFGFFAEEDGN